MASTLDPVTQAGIGAFAGLVEVTAQQPLLTAKNFIQDGRSLPLTNPAVWYRGWAAGLLMCVPMTVVQFGASRFLEQAFENRGDASGAATMSSSGDPPPAASASVPFTTKLTSAWCAGALSAVFVQPLCLCQIQQQKFGGSLVDTGRRLINSHGVRVLAHAGYLTIAREAFYSCGYLCFVPVSRDWVRVEQPDLYARLGEDGVFASCAVVSGLLAATITQPMDAVKTLMQSNLGVGNGDVAMAVSFSKSKKTSPTPTGGEGGARFSGLGYTETAYAAVKEGGLKSLWKGIGPRGARVVGATFILSYVNERAGAAIAGWDEKETAGVIGG